MSLIVDLWQRQPGDYFCISTKSKAGAWHDEFFARNEFGDIEEFIEENTGKDIYACPHGFARKRRLRQWAELPKLLWSDLDEASPRSIEPRPTIAIASSPGRYVGLWETNHAVTEELNRRLAYHVGADKSGWDLTQVLRLAIGTRNWKYVTTPRVKLLWDDGPTYRVRDLERELPTLAPKKNADEVGIDFDNLPDCREVFRKYPKAKSRSGVPARRYVLSPPTQGKRSDTVHAIACAYVREGATREEVASVIMASGSFKSKWGDSTKDAAREVAVAMRECA
jgi:hypothetical protein